MDPVVRNDGHICERSELESMMHAPREKVGALDEFTPLKAIEQVIQLLLSSGQFDKKYLPNKDKPLASKANKNKDDIISFIKARSNEGDTGSIVELGEIDLNVHIVEKEEKTAIQGFMWPQRRGVT